MIPQLTKPEREKFAELCEEYNVKMFYSERRKQNTSEFMVNGQPKGSGWYYYHRSTEGPPYGGRCLAIGPIATKTECVRQIIKELGSVVKVSVKVENASVEISA